MLSSSAQKVFEYTCNTQGRYQCPHCDSDFTKSSSVAQHVLSRCTALFPEKIKPPVIRYTRTAQGRYQCPHCDMDFTKNSGAAQHVLSRCTTLFPEKIKQPKKVDHNLPVGSRVNVLWGGVRYPATISGRQCAYDVAFDDGSYGESLTVNEHELKALRASSAGSTSAQKRPASQVVAADYVPPRKKSKMDDAADATTPGLGVPTSTKIEGSIGTVGVAAVQNLAAYYKEKTAEAEDLAKYHEGETGMMHIFSSKQTTTIDRLTMLALNAGVDAGVVTEAAKVV